MNAKCFVAAIIVVLAAIGIASAAAGPEPLSGMYLSCSGTGSPAVVLESGLGEASDDWKLIAPLVARETQVCVYDRAGVGRSGPSSRPRDGVGISEDLHELLEHAHIAGPLVLVGHSSGAQYVRVFAGRYPAHVAGMVLLDGQPADAFTALPDYPAFYRRFRRVSVVLPLLSRLGVRSVRGMREEFAQLPAALAQAGAAGNLGERPLIVVSAASGAQPGWLAAQDGLTSLSTNHLHRVIADATHESLLKDRHHAVFSTQAILDVVASVRACRAGVPGRDTLFHRHGGIA